MKLLLIEDNKQMAETIENNLRKQYVLDVAHTGDRGEYLSYINEYDLILLDLGLPDMDGVEVCSRIRSNGNTIPILAITGRTKLGDKVRTLDGGVDDYLTKPFRFEELQARIRALLRRKSQPMPINGKLTVGDLTLDIPSRSVRRAELAISLRPKEFQLLEYLMRNQGKVEERAKQIRNAQLKQVMELYRFADFGKLAAGLFHDLVDPLSVISLNLENLNHETRRKKLDTEGKANIRSALKMVTENQRRVEAYVNSTRRQLQGQQLRTGFDLKAEIDRALADLTPKANSSRVLLEFQCRKPIFTFGNPPRFHQLMHNLISNAIDAYDGARRRKNRMVIIKLACQEKQVICSVADFGSGISNNHLPQIFTPFFTTKPLDKGIGIGLSILRLCSLLACKGQQKDI